MTSRNGVMKIVQSIRITSKTSLENKEVEPVELVQMNIYQSHTYRKDLSWLHFDDKPSIEERQQVKHQLKAVLAIEIM